MGKGSLWSITCLGICGQQRVLLGLIACVSGVSVFVLVSEKCKRGRPRRGIGVYVGVAGVLSWNWLVCDIGYRKVVVVFVIEWGEGTRARWSIMLTTHAISARSTSDFAIRFQRARDCCFMTSRRLMDCWRMFSNGILMCWGEGPSV